MLEKRGWWYIFGGGDVLSLLPVTARTLVFKFTILPCVQSKKQIIKYLKITITTHPK